MHQKTLFVLAIVLAVALFTSTSVALDQGFAKTKKTPSNSVKKSKKPAVANLTDNILNQTSVASATTTAMTPVAIANTNASSIKTICNDSIVIQNGQSHNALVCYAITVQFK